MWPVECFGLERPSPEGEPSTRVQRASALPWPDGEQVKCFPFMFGFLGRRASSKSGQIKRALPCKQLSTVEGFDFYASEGQLLCSNQIHFR